MDLRDKINSVVAELAAKIDGFDRSELDELIVLVDLERAKLPSRFITVISQFDKNFQSRGTSLGRHAQAEFAQRLVTILDVDSNFGSRRSDDLVGDEIIPKFSLNAKDKKRVLELCTQMRKIVLASEVFDQPHRRRLLNRIAGIEHQVEQPKGLLDIVRAGVSDVGETLGKFGTDIKPLTDRMKEVAKIARSNSPEYNQIPAPEDVKQIEDQTLSEDCD